MLENIKPFSKSIAWAALSAHYNEIKDLDLSE